MHLSVNCQLFNQNIFQIDFLFYLLAGLGRIPLVQLRHLAIDHAELKHEIEELRNQTEERFRIVFEVLDKLVSNEDSVRVIGFVSKDK
ncbi:MAG: hypothetical protein GY705_31200 [Bacteroidetes bacterium]|nr:hypothetical protein [Bacteroidota bacterium]